MYCYVRPHGAQSQARLGNFVWYLPRNVFRGSRPRPRQMPDKGIGFYLPVQVGTPTLSCGVQGGASERQLPFCRSCPLCETPRLRSCSGVGSRPWASPKGAYTTPLRPGPVALSLMMPAGAGVDPLTEAFQWAHRAVAVLAESRGKRSLQARPGQRATPLAQFNCPHCPNQLRVGDAPRRLRQVSFLAHARRMSTHCAGFLTAERSIDFLAAAVAGQPDLGFRVVLHAAAGCVRQAELIDPLLCPTKHDRRSFPAPRPARPGRQRAQPEVDAARHRRGRRILRVSRHP